MVAALLVLGRRRHRFASLSVEDRRLLVSEGNAGIFEGQPVGRLLVVGAIIVLLSCAAVVFAVGTKASLAMQVGDCFTVDGKASIEQISAIPCALPHVTEVFAIVDVPAPSGAPYPGLEVVREAAMPGCRAAYPAYVGAPWTPTSKWWISAMTPEEPYWAIGVRSNYCTVVSMTGGQVTGSARGSGN